MVVYVLLRNVVGGIGKVCIWVNLTCLPIHDRRPRICGLARFTFLSCLGMSGDTSYDYVVVISSSEPKAHR